MTREELIEAMARAMLAYTKENAWSLSQVQGFRYGSDHVVRDCMLPHHAQEVWRAPVSNTSPEEMCDFIEQYNTQRGMSAALAALEAAGVRLVPVDMSRHMLLAAHMAERDDIAMTEDEHRAMYAAVVADRAYLLRALDEAQERAERAEAALANLADCQPLPKVYKYTGTAEVDVENMFDVGHRHRNGKQPRDYLMSWLSMFRPFAYATKDDSWGELEKLISITMNNYVQILVKAEKARAALKETGQ